MKTTSILTFTLLMWCPGLWANSFQLTQLEQQWLAAHPEITVGTVLSHPPQSMVDERGVPQGIDPDVIRLLNEKLSGRLTIVPGKWEKIFKKATEKQIDVLMDVTPSEERRAYFNYTRPYISFPHVIVASKEGRYFFNMAELKGQAVALIRSTFLFAFIKKHYPDIKIVEYGDDLEALRGVQRGEADAHIGSSHVLRYLINKNDLQDLDLHGQSVETSETNVIAVRKDWPILVSLLDRALASISHKKMSAVMSKYTKADKVISNGSNIGITADERDWIQNHSEIIIGASTDWPPYDYVENDEPTGYANEYISLLAEKIGLNIKFVYGYSWNELLDQMRQKEIDILPSLAFRPERQDYMNFTNSYMEIADCLVLHENTKKISTLDDMAGKRLAIIEGYSVNKVLLEKYPQIKVVTYDSPIDALVAVSEGRVDGYTDNMGVVNYLRREHFITDLQIVNTHVLDKTKQHIGVRKDWTILKVLLEKAMTTVTQDEVKELKETWILSPDMDSGKFRLTHTEIKLLSNIDSLHVGVSDSWAPFEFTDEAGNPLGISTEYINLIRNRLELDLKLTPGSWPETYEGVRAGAIDILPAVINTEERQKHLTFTKPYLRLPVIVGTRTDFRYLTHIGDLKDDILGVSKGDGIQKKLKRDYPSITIKEYENVEKAILAVKSREISAVITNSSVFSHYQNILGLEELHINNTTPYDAVLAMGVKNDLAALVPFLNRMIDRITPEEHTLIMEKWTQSTMTKAPDWMVIVKFGLVMIVIVIFWNLKLSTEIKKRTESEERLSLAAESGNFGMWEWHVDTGTVTVSEEWLEVTGFTSEEIQTKYVPLTPEKWLTTMHPDDRERLLSDLTDHLNGETDRFEGAYRHESPDKSWVWLSIFGRVIKRNAGGEPLRMVGFQQNISASKEAELALRNSELQLQNIVDSMHIGVFIKDLDYRYTLVNRYWENNTGNSRGFTVGKTGHEVLSKKAALFDYENHQKVLATLRPITLEENYQTPSGERSFITNYVPLLDADGKPYAVCGVATDITTNKRNAEHLKKYADTQAILLREVNHRVKNNLTTIISMLHIEEDRAVDRDVTDYHSPFKVLENRVTGLLTVHSLLSANMWGALELSKLCEEVVSQSLQGVLTIGGFNLEVEPCSLLVESDMAHHLTLILNELATNTTKHGIGDGGSIEIKISFEKRAKGMVCLIYADNGPGFPDKVLNGQTSIHSIGVEMTDSVVRRNMQGQIKRYNNGGAITEICFPLQINNA